MSGKSKEKEKEKDKDKSKDKEKETYPEKLMDLRLRDKLLGEGKISKNQVDQFLASLPDDQENVDYSELVEGSEVKAPKITGQQKM